MDDTGAPVKKKSKLPCLIVLGCVGIVVLCGGGFMLTLGGGALAVFSSLKSSVAYAVALQRAQQDPGVTEGFGGVVQPVSVPSGSINKSTNNGVATGAADINIPISGPKGRGSIHVVAHIENGNWLVTELVVKKDDTGTVWDLTPPPTGAATPTESAPEPTESSP